MTYEEAKSKITELISKPEEAQTKAIDLLADLEKDYTSLESLTQKSKEDDAKIKDLQTTNQKLFLSITSDIKNSGEGEEEKDEDPQQAFKKLFDEQYYKNKNKEV